MMTRAKGVAARTAVEAKMLIPFYLRRGRCKEIDVHTRRGPVSVAGVRARPRSHTRPHMSGKVGIRMWGRNIGRADLRDGRGPGHGQGLGRRGHHGPVSVDDSIVLVSDGRGGRGGKMLGLVIPSGIRVVVDSRVTGELIGATKAFGAARELAGMRLLTRVRANVSGLMLQAVEGTVAKGALVRAREILSHFAVCRTAALHDGR